MDKMKIKKGDKVNVIAGNGAHSGKDGKQHYEGKVLTALPKERRVIIEGYNMVTKHQKPRGAGKPAGIIHQEAAVHVSNVMLICPNCSKPARVGYKVLGDNTKVRYCKKCSETIDK